MSIPSKTVYRLNSANTVNFWDIKKRVNRLGDCCNPLCSQEQNRLFFLQNTGFNAFKLFFGKIHFCLKEFILHIQQTRKHILEERSSFGAVNERLFWKEQLPESLSTLKAALLLGIIGFLAFVLLDFFTKDLSVYNLLTRLPIVIVLLTLLLGLQCHPLSKGQIGRTAKLSASISILYLVLITLNEQNPALYTEKWIGLLPVYFFIYGQLFMTVTETLMLGWLAMLLLPLSAYMTGVQLTAIMPSILILLLVNLFGFCTRSQLEIHARREFIAKHKAETADINKTRFLQHFSHNIRQPLQTLSCQSTVLEAACSSLNLDSIQYLAGKMGNNIDELNKIFNTILKLTNLETGIQKPMLMPVDINILLSALEYQFAPQAAASALRLKVNLRSTPPFNVYTDYSMLSQIISNLIDNAIKYTKTGWILVSAVKMPGPYLKLHVCDSGRGFCTDTQYNKNIGFRHNDPPIPGYGIGLSYVNKAIQSLPDHTITVYSQLNRGSDFRIKIPVADTADTVIDRESNKDKLAGKFAFIVDDDEQLLSALEQQISSYGCLVQTATSLSAAQLIIADNYLPPDLLISDFCLENEETAHDIIAFFSKMYGQIPTLILSAHAIPKDDKAKLPKQTLLLRKPANNAQILEKLTALLLV